MQPEQNVIDQTISAVAAAQSSRLFKSEVNTVARSAVVFVTIAAEISLALYDAGVPLEVVVEEIDPTDIIVDQMLKDGYVLEGVTNA